ncbi:uncharacterized protein LOC126884453 [Diabrotica virgifera virgifera]|uniref:Uncharacterized protein n=1 Tax=Diabrotica virgifera virgifera TaxID=50390 RepID=A0ABM5K822_DIAVI|nr:uncharacterized protein LOC126884453 [Diabrotica virgifera virgifera]
MVDSQVFARTSERLTNKSVSPGAIDSKNTSNSNDVYHSSNGPNAFPQVNNGPNQSNILSYLNSLKKIQSYPVPRGEIIENEYLSDPEKPRTSPMPQPIPPAAICSLCGGNFG